MNLTLRRVDQALMIKYQRCHKDRRRILFLPE